MAVPGFQDLMLPFLQICKDGGLFLKSAYSLIIILGTTSWVNL